MTATEYDNYEPECANCGISVHVLDGMEFNEGDWCYDCLGREHRRIMREREEAIRQRDAMLAECERLIASGDVGRMFAGRRILDSIKSVQPPTQQLEGESGR